MKYKYILHFVQSTAGGSYFTLADTRSGRTLSGSNVPESNARAVLYILNGNQHKQNFWQATTTLSSRQFKHYSEDIPYIGCNPDDIAAAFRKMMKSRKKVKA